MIVVGIQLSKDTYVRMCVLEKGQLIKAKPRVTTCLQQNLHNLLTSLSFKLNRTSKEKKPTKQNKTKQTKNTMCYQKSRGTVVTSRCHGSKTFRSQQTLVLQTWQEKKMICVNFGGMIALMIKNRTKAHRLFVSGSKMKMTVRLYQERLLRFRNFASMVTWRFSFL